MIVPAGQPTIWAISWYEKPSTQRSTIASRKGSGQRLDRRQHAAARLLAIHRVERIGLVRRDLLDRVVHVGRRAAAGAARCARRCARIANSQLLQFPVPAPPCATRASARRYVSCTRSSAVAPSRRQARARSRRGRRGRLDGRLPERALHRRLGHEPPLAPLKSITPGPPPFRPAGISARPPCSSGSGSPNGGRRLAAQGAGPPRGVCLMRLSRTLGWAASFRCWAWPGVQAQPARPAACRGACRPTSGSCWCRRRTRSRPSGWRWDASSTSTSGCRRTAPSPARPVTTRRRASRTARRSRRASAARRARATRPTVLNAIFNEFQFWDGRAASLEEQAKGPMINPVEMGMAQPRRRGEGRRHPGLPGRLPEGLRARPPASTTWWRRSPRSSAPWSRGDSPSTASWPATRRRCRRRRSVAGTLWNGKARCNTCHPFGDATPNFSDNKFHNIGVAAKGRDFGAIARQAASVSDPAEARVPRGLHGAGPLRRDPPAQGHRRLQDARPARHRAHGALHARRQRGDAARRGRSSTTRAASPTRTSTAASCR